MASYIFEALRGVGLGREVALDIVIEKEKDKEYIRVSSKGTAEGMKTVPDAIREALK